MAIRGCTQKKFALLGIILCCCHPVNPRTFEEMLEPFASQLDMTRTHMMAMILELVPDQTDMTNLGMALKDVDVATFGKETLRKAMAGLGLNTTNFDAVFAKHVHSDLQMGTTAASMAEAQWKPRHGEEAVVDIQGTTLRPQGSFDDKPATPKRPIGYYDDAANTPISYSGHQKQEEATNINVLEPAATDGGEHQTVAIQPITQEPPSEQNVTSNIEDKPTTAKWPGGHYDVAPNTPISDSGGQEQEQATGANRLEPTGADNGEDEAAGVQPMTPEPPVEQNLTSKQSVSQNEGGTGDSGLQEQEGATKTNRLELNGADDGENETAGVQPMIPEPPGEQNSATSKQSVSQNEEGTGDSEFTELEKGAYTALSQALGKSELEAKAILEELVPDNNTRAGLVSQLHAEDASKMTVEQFKGLLTGVGVDESKLDATIEAHGVQSSSATNSDAVAIGITDQRERTDTEPKEDTSEQQGGAASIVKTTVSQALAIVLLGIPFGRFRV